MNKTENENELSQSRTLQPAVKQFWERREIAYTEKRINAISAATKILEERQKKIDKRERIIVYSLLAFTVVFALSIWLTNGRVIDHTAEFLQSFETSLIRPSKNEAVNCRLDSNKNTPYCLNRTGKIEGDWQNIIRNRNVDKNQFTLHK